jgi:hypothetical protein
MARPNLFTHRKFRALARGVKSKALAVGILELLWAAANDAGDALLGSSDDVEDIADWRGKQGTLTAMLVKVGFIDATSTGYEVHDHAHHCPQYVRRRREREQKRRGSDAPVTSQELDADKPVSSTPNSHLPTPHTQSAAEPPRVGAATRRPSLIERRNGRIQNPGQPVKLFDWQFGKFRDALVPKFGDDAYGETLRFMNAEDEAASAGGQVIAEDPVKWWDARFRARFGGGDPARRGCRYGHTPPCVDDVACLSRYQDEQLGVAR